MEAIRWGSGNSDQIHKSVTAHMVPPPSCENIGCAFLQWKATPNRTLVSISSYILVLAITSLYLMYHCPSSFLSLSLFLSPHTLSVSSPLSPSSFLSFSLFLDSISHAQVSSTLKKKKQKNLPSNLQLTMFLAFSFSVPNKFRPSFSSPSLLMSLNLDLYFALHWNSFARSSLSPMLLNHVLVTISWPLSIMWHNWPVPPSWNSHFFLTAHTLKFSSYHFGHFSSSIDFIILMFLWAHSSHLKEPRHSRISTTILRLMSLQSVSPDQNWFLSSSMIYPKANWTSLGVLQKS